MQNKLIAFILTLTMMGILSTSAIAAPQDTLLLTEGSIGHYPPEVTVESVVSGEDAKNIVFDLKSSSVNSDSMPENTPEHLSSIKEQFIVREFETFLESKNLNLNEGFTPENVQEFLDYAVETGIIKDRDASLKDIVRASMLLVSAGGSMVGLTLSSFLLTHSCQDSPPDYTGNRGSTLSNIVKNSSEHKDLMTVVKFHLGGETGQYYSLTGSMTLKSTSDLNLALNKVSFILGAEKIGTRWDIYVRYYDVYNFEYLKWSKITNLPQNAKTALNNYGHLAQSIGAVVPYSITIYTLDVAYGYFSQRK